jgi:plastocyanin
MSRAGLLFLLALPVLACGGDQGPREPAPATAAVTVGNDYFRSDRNGTENRAIDTVRVGGTVTWTWIEVNGFHSVEPNGTPGFTPSDVLSGQGSQFQVTFTAKGTYEYVCGVHGSPMLGRIVVE